jgi:hypothetical protein
MPVYVVGAPGSDLELVEEAFGIERVAPDAITGLGADPTTRFAYVYRDPHRAIHRGADADAWQAATDALLVALESLAPDQWCVVDADVLLTDRATELRRIARFVDLPVPDVVAVDDGVAATANRVRELIAAPQRALGGFESQHTATFAELLEAIGSSVLVSTYQTGRVFAIRADGGRINTHFRAFGNPMGMAAVDNRLVIGTRLAVLESVTSSVTRRGLPPLIDHSHRTAAGWNGRVDSC